MAWIALKASVSVGLDQAAVCLTSDCVQETPGARMLQAAEGTASLAQWRVTLLNT